MTTTKKRPVATTAANGGRTKGNKASRTVGAGVAGPLEPAATAAPAPLAALPSTNATRLPPSAPVSSLLPPITSASAPMQASSSLPGSAAGHPLVGGGFGIGGGGGNNGMGLQLPNPAAQQLLSHYALLLHSAGALATPSQSSLSTVPSSGNNNNNNQNHNNTVVAVAAPATAAPDAAAATTTASVAAPPSLPSVNNNNTANAAAAAAPHVLLQSLAHMVAAQAQAQAAVVAQAQAAAAMQAHHQAQQAAAATAAAARNSTALAAGAPAPSATATNSTHGSTNSNNNNFILPNGLQNWPSAATSSQGHSTVQPVTGLAPTSRPHQHHPTLQSSAPVHHHSHPPQQAFSLLLSEAQRRHDKKEAKRVANRKSASVSRARKKALVQEMTQLNARLKRQALILALLPDLILAVDSDGRITFCSDQVGRVLRHCPDDVLGAPLADLLVPSSRIKLHKLLQGLGTADDNNPTTNNGKLQQQLPPTERQTTTVVVQVVSEASAAGPTSHAEGNGTSKPPPPPAVLSTSANTAAPSTDAPFPLSVVNVEPAQPKSSLSSGKVPSSSRRHDDTNDASDTSASRTSQQPSSLTNSGGGASVSRSPLAADESSGGNSRSDDASRRAPPPPDAQGGGGGTAGPTSATGGKKSSSKGLLPSSDTSNTSSSASSNDAEVKKLTKANANLGRNVRWHNKKMMQSKRSSGGNDDDDDDDVEEDLDGGFKDDVLGAAVTANNASARLSSLRVLPESERCRPEQPASSEEEDDSGYRESNESREESSSSSASDDSDTNGRRKPLAPTCNICLIRNDLTTVWCEVTSSVRTREPDEAVDANLQEPTTTPADDNDADDPQGTTRVSGASQASAGGESFPEESQPRRRPAPVVKELLLCLRPIRDGDERVDEKYRFVPFHGWQQQQRQGLVSEGSSSYLGRSMYDGGDKSSSASDSGAAKRRAEEAVEASPRKVRRTGTSATSGAGKATTLGVDAAVAESLVLMSSKKA